MKKLNLGCENEYRHGWVNLDFDKSVKADTYWNLNKFPYPFKGDEFDEILASAILEHVADFTKTMLELYRISKDKGRIYILLPHASEIANSWAEIEHQRGFSAHTFGNWWTNKEMYPLFHVLKKRVFFTRSRMVFLNKLINPIVNLGGAFIWERLLSGIVPCAGFVNILEVIKDKDVIQKRKEYITHMENQPGNVLDNYTFIKNI